MEIIPAAQKANSFGMEPLVDETIEERDESDDSR